MDKAIVEAAKEFGRVVVLAIIPVLVDSLASGELNFRLVWVTGAIAGLRFIDKLLHEWGKDEENDTLAKGLTRF